MRRIYHSWDKWECFRAGFYATSPPDGMTSEDASESYSVFLRDLKGFYQAMERVSLEWPNSCEHFLTNRSINRIAWLGQSAMCIETGVPSIYKSGFQLLSDEQRRMANETAQLFLTKWEDEHEGEDKTIHPVMEEAGVSR